MVLLLVYVLIAGLGQPRCSLESFRLGGVPGFHLQDAEGILQKRMVGLSLWTDSAPTTWNRDSSVEVFTCALPGLSMAPWKDVRLIFTALPHNLTTTNTLHAVIKIFHGPCSAYPTQRRFVLHGPCWIWLDPRWPAKACGFTACLPGSRRLVFFKRTALASLLGTLVVGLSARGAKLQGST